MTPPAPALACARWVKAKASSTNQGCVEIAHLDDGRVALRDSKHPGTAPFVFTRHEWDCFLDGARNGEFDQPA
ncbi:MAG: DUF397 domain-containing protein [Nocardiopsaceae bacterium]|jgi:hypothetical protein|nr:DUF397 domain-containing protein [Nocardiopsaceae bacterium]